MQGAVFRLHTQRRMLHPTSFHKQRPYGLGISNCTDDATSLLEEHSTDLHTGDSASTLQTYRYYCSSKDVPGVWKTCWRVVSRQCDEQEFGTNRAAVPSLLADKAMT